MPQTTFITEKALLYRLECPIRSCGQNTVQEESPILICAETTAQWLIAEIVDGRTPSLQETHRRYFAEWEQTAYFRSRAGIPQKEYAIRMWEGIRACRRLRDIIWRCEILQPVTPYRLAIGDVVITGEYAVLCFPRRKKHAFALYLRHGGVKIRPLVPDVVSFARMLDLSDRWSDPSNRHWAIETIGVMHYWVARDFHLEHKIDRNFSSDVLLGAVGVITGNPFPLPGEHCSSCPTRACRPDELIRLPASSTSIILAR
jgi:hypothetical protein